MGLTMGFRLSPGCCHQCRTTDQTLWTWNTAREDPGHRLRQQVYLCQRCIMAVAEQMAPQTGMVLMAQDRFDALAELVVAAEGWQARAERAEALVRSLAELASDAEAVPA